MIDLQKYDIIDLSHELYHGMPGWPTHTNFSIEDLKINNRDGYAVKQLSMNTHHGTHIDTQAHVKYGGRTLSDYPLTSFIGDGVVLDFSHKGNDEEITDIDFKAFDNEIRENDIVMLHTGWDSYRGFNTKYLYHWPFVGVSGAKYLSGKRIKMVGTEGLSIAGWGGTTAVQGPVTDSGLEVHQILLNNNIVIVEELTNLGKVLEGKKSSRAFFIVLPLNLKNVDGSPVRALAIVEKQR
ncbi:MAG: cyclase family protein [Thermoplasmatales archaeon]